MRGWLALVGMLLLAGCGTDDPLADDPNGREACTQLVISREHADDVGVKVGAMLAAGQAAVKAETAAIRNAVGDPIEGLEEFPTVDEQALEAACEDAGVDVPEAS